MKKILLFIIAQTFIITVFSQTFNLNYSTNYDESGLNIIEYKSNNYILVGSQRDTISGHYSGIILKINKNGTITDKKIYDFPNNRFFFNKIFKTADNKLYVNGNFNFRTNFLWEIDTNLNALHQYKYNFDNISTHLRFSLPIFYNEKIYTAGIDTNSEHYLQRPVIIEFSDKYEFIATHKLSMIPDSANPYIFNPPTMCIIDSNFYMFFNNTNPNSFIYKINPNYKTITTLYFNNFTQVLGNLSAIFFSDTSFLINSTQEINPENPQYNNIIFQVDTNLTAHTYKICTYDVDDGYSNVNTLDYFNKKFIYTTRDSTIICLDNNLNILWRKYIRTSDTYYIFNYGCFSTQDNGVIVIIEGRNSLNSTNSNINIIKLDSLGNYPLPITSLPKGIKISDFAVYPNPASDFINIKKAVQIEQANFILYNQLGQKILQHSLNEDVTNVNIQNLPTGNYVYNIIQNGKIIDSGKIVKQK